MPKVQCYDEQGQPLEHGADRQQVYEEGVLHGAAHVWLWRPGVRGPEILLQQRAAGKRTWPGCYDVSAAGHIDLGETPLQAARRETREELDLELAAADVHLLGVYRADLTTPDGSRDNEYQWLYITRYPEAAEPRLQQEEVAALVWRPLHRFESEAAAAGSRYVPHGRLYYGLVAEAVGRHSG